MAEKEDTWSWWDMLKAGAMAAGTGVGIHAVNRMVRGQAMVNDLNTARRMRREANPVLTKIAADQLRYSQVANKELPAARAKVRAASDALVAGTSRIPLLERSVLDLKDRALEDAYYSLLARNNQFYQEIRNMKTAGLTEDGIRKAIVSLGIDDQAWRSTQSGKIYGPNETPSRSDGISLPWAGLGGKIARPSFVKSPVEDFRLGNSFAEEVARGPLPRAMREYALADRDYQAGMEDISRLTQEKAGLAASIPRTAAELRDYFEQRRLFLARRNAPAAPWLPTGMSPGRETRKAAREDWYPGRSAEPLAGPPAGSARVQGPFERVAKIAWSFLYPRYRVEPPPEPPEGSKPNLLDRVQAKVAESKWSRYLASGSGWLAAAAFAGKGVYDRTQKERDRRDVENYSRLTASERDAAWNGAVQAAAAVDPNTMYYGMDGLDKVVAGAAAARGLSQPDVAEKLLDRIPPKALYQYGFLTYRATDPRLRAALGSEFAGRDALDLSNDEMRTFARRHLGMAANKYLDSWTNAAPSSAGGGR